MTSCSRRRFRLCSGMAGVRDPPPANIPKAGKKKAHFARMAIRDDFGRYGLPAERLEFVSILDFTAHSLILLYEGGGRVPGTCSFSNSNGMPVRT